MSERKILDAAFFEETAKDHHTCYPDFHPLRRGNDCGCKCGRAYVKGQVVIIHGGGRNTPECTCNKRGVRERSIPEDLKQMHAQCIEDPCDRDFDNSEVAGLIERIGRLLAPKGQP